MSSSECDYLARIRRVRNNFFISCHGGVKDDLAEVWILDETGTMFYQQQQFHDHLTLLNPYSRFLQSVIFRQGAMAGLAVTKTPRLYQLTKGRDTTESWKVREKLMIDELTMTRYSNIQVIASENQQDKPLFTYYCNDIEFSPLEYGDQLLSAVAKQILRFRNKKKRYPAYITDLDISAFVPKNRQSICQYLEIKKTLEAALLEEIHKN